MSELLTATDLEQWSERNDSREHLPTLVRRLILATAAPDSLRMPAAEGVGLPGLDGEVTCPAGAPPFVPAGTSVWEMGTGNDPQSKAQSDYRKRLDEFTPEQRAGLEFVFVTSRRWPDSQAWIARRGNDDDGWAGIRVLDAEDLAAWLALCTGVHRWLASEQLGRDPHGLIGLREWYRNWAERTHPSIPPALLLCGRDAQVRNLLAGLRAAPREHVIASASRDESVAFFAASLLAVPPIAEAAQRHVTDDPPSTVIEEGQVDVTDPHHGDVGDGPAAQDTAPAPDVDSERQALLERAVVVEDARAWRQVAAHERPMTLVPSSPSQRSATPYAPGITSCSRVPAGRPTRDSLGCIGRWRARCGQPPASTMTAPKSMAARPVAAWLPCVGASAGQAGCASHRGRLTPRRTCSRRSC